MQIGSEVYFIVTYIFLAVVTKTIKPFFSKIYIIGLVSKKRNCGVTSSTKFEVLLVHCYVALVLFLCFFVSVIVIGRPGIIQPYQIF